MTALPLIKTLRASKRPQKAFSRSTPVQVIGTVSRTHAVHKTDPVHLQQDSHFWGTGMTRLSNLVHSTHEHVYQQRLKRRSSILNTKRSKYARRRRTYSRNPHL